MKTLATLCGLLLFPGAPAGADLASWVVATDRRDNAVIATVILESPFQEQIAVVRALAKRKDFNLSEIIDCLAATRPGGGSAQLDYLLRLLLATVFPLPSPGPDHDGEEEALRDRLMANRESFDRLAATLGSRGDLQLRAEIVRLLPYSGSPSRRSLLLTEADQILELLTDGVLTSCQEDYVLTCLLAIRQQADPVFLESCLRIYERSTQPAVVRLSRTVAAGLLASAPPLPAD